MPKLIKNVNKDENTFKNYFHQKYFVVNNLSQLKKLKKDTELCIIQLDLKQKDISLIKKYINIYKNTEFWIALSNQSKENVLIANKIGIKNIISSPIDKNLVEEFFYKKYNKFNNIKKNEKIVDYSDVLNSKIMIVDDNPMNVQLLEEILSELGLNIKIFLKPKEAYSAAMKEKFDLFLLDIMMPEMSGFELAKKIKNTSINKNIPFVFISALSDSYNKMKGYDLGSIAYIEKPFDINVVKSQILNILRNKKTQESIVSEQETFFAAVTHDLKTPISGEINALKLLLNQSFGNIDEQQKEILQELLISAKFTKNMVDNVLCKNKIENNKIELSKQMHSLEDCIECCVELTKYLLLPKKQRITLNCKTGDTLIPFDYTEIQRAINNLIANASEYSPIDSNIVIEIFKSKQRLGVSVQDFGKGIPPEEQEYVFSEYVSYAKKYKKVGSGLGLYITQNIIEEHHGEIFLESQEGKGTKITFFLPLYIKE